MNRRARRRARPRDTDATIFTALLVDLMERIPGAIAAALVDRDGECVDYAGRLSPFDVKVAGAHWRIVLNELGEVEVLRAPRLVVVRAEKRSFMIRALADAYAAVVVLSRGAGFGVVTRALDSFERALRSEGIGDPLPGKPSWAPVWVDCDVRGRPASVRSARDAAPLDVEILGAVMGLARGERGYRVRLSSGVEATLVRERGGAWYADELIGTPGTTP